MRTVLKLLASHSALVVALVAGVALVGSGVEDRALLIYVATGGLVLAGVLSIILGTSLLRPLRRVREAAAAMARGDLSRRVRPARRDELGALGSDLDALADQLQHRVADLEREREEMETLIDSMAEGVLAVDGEGRATRANPAARAIFGLGDREVRGLKPEEVARRAGFVQLVRRAAAGESLPPTELRYDEKHLLVTAEPLPRGGAVLVLLDITELRRLEGVRRDFVANVSHELKTPLTVIRGHSETLLDDELPADLRHRFAETVRKNADRLHGIVDDLLDLSRIESGGWTPQWDDVDLAELAQRAWEPFREEASRRGVEFRARTDGHGDDAGGGHGARARGDASALGQVFSNLFSNALRYTPDGGRIEVVVRPAPARGEWVVEVRDTGSGIPRQHLDRIFERFYRVDPARSRAAGGTGLGLSIVRHLVERHGGTVEADSRLGSGTVIRFTVPRAGPREPQDPRP